MTLVFCRKQWKGVPPHASVYQNKQTTFDYLHTCALLKDHSNKCYCGCGVDEKENELALQSR